MPAVFSPDPDLPHLEIAGDARRMHKLFQEHLRPLPGRGYEIPGCRLSRIRYRRGERCVLQYTLGLADPDTGREREQWAVGVLYPGDRARRAWEKLQGSPPLKLLDPFSTYEPYAFIPELRMLVQVFPYDRRLPALAPLLSVSPPPEIVHPILSSFGTGIWRIERWGVEATRYRAGLGATLRLTVRAGGGAGRSRERRFYVKVYRREESGELAHRALLELAGRAGEGFSVAGPVAYGAGLRTLVQEEAPGIPLRHLLVREDGTRAIRRCAQALAAFHLGPPPVSFPRFGLEDEIAVLRRVKRTLSWARPDLDARICSTLDAAMCGLQEGSPAPAHGDLKPEHILIDGERVFFVDLDNFCRADPLLDVANLLAHLSALPFCSPVAPEKAAEAGQTFREEYFSCVPESWQERLRARHAGALLKISVGLFRRQVPGWPAGIEALLDRAGEVLAADPVGDPAR